MCLACGFYNGKIVIDMAKRASERAARIKATKERRKGEQSVADTAPEAEVASETK
jgi:hypothetical protein